MTRIASGSLDDRSSVVARNRLHGDGLSSYHEDGSLIAKELIVSNLDVVVFMDLGWNGVELQVDGQISVPSAQMLREKETVEKFWSGELTDSNSASLRFGGVEFAFKGFEGETAFPARWGDDEEPQRQYVTAWFELPDSLSEEFFDALEIEPDFEDDVEFTEFPDLEFSVIFDGKPVNLEIEPTLSIRAN